MALEHRCELSGDSLAGNLAATQSTKWAIWHAMGHLRISLGTLYMYNEHYHGDLSHHFDIVFEASRGKNSRKMILR